MAANLLCLDAGGDGLPRAVRKGFGVLARQCGALQQAPTQCYATTRPAARSQDQGANASPHGVRNLRSPVRASDRRAVRAKAHPDRWTRARPAQRVWRGLRGGIEQFHLFGRNYRPDRSIGCMRLDQAPAKACRISRMQPPAVWASPRSSRSLRASLGLTIGYRLNESGSSLHIRPCRGGGGRYGRGLGVSGSARPPRRENDG